MPLKKHNKPTLRHWDCELRRAFLGLPEKEIIAIFKEVHHAAREKNLTYERDGRYDVINLLPLPLVAGAHQIRYLHRTSLILKKALSRLIDIYCEVPSARDVLPMTDEEEIWVRDTWKGSRKMSGIWSRLDFHFDIYHPNWKDTLTFFENNSVAVGGNHYVPIAEELIYDIVLPALKRRDKNIRLERNGDIRNLLCHEIVRHTEAAGRTGLNIAFAEDRTLTSGITEFPSLARFYNKKSGKEADLKIHMIDPRELYLKRDEIYYKNHEIDIIYRDFELFELLKMGKGPHLEALKTAFKRNQVISGIAGEFDHKGSWEILRDKRYSGFFNEYGMPEILNHIPWTKVIRDTRTDSPCGDSVELLNYTRKNRESLVIKPNRGFGGYGITIGRDATQQQWDEAVDRGCKESGEWVAQEYRRVTTKLFPAIDDHGDILFEEFHMVYGVTGTAEGIGILGRASRKKIVNVAQQGGIVAVMKEVGT